MIYTIAQKYNDKYGDRAILLFATDLMAGDPSNFKAGYSRENAIIATADAFGVSRDEVEEKLS